MKPLLALQPKDCKAKIFEIEFQLIKLERMTEMVEEKRMREVANMDNNSEKIRNNTRMGNSTLDLTPNSQPRSQVVQESSVHL